MGEMTAVIEEPVKNRFLTVTTDFDEFGRKVVRVDTDAIRSSVASTGIDLTLTGGDEILDESFLGESYSWSRYELLEAQDYINRCLDDPDCTVVFE